VSKAFQDAGKAFQGTGKFAFQVNTSGIAASTNLSNAGGGGHKKRWPLSYDDWRAFSEYREAAQQLRKKLDEPKPVKAEVQKAAKQLKRVVKEIAAEEYIPAPMPQLDWAGFEEMRRQLQVLDSTMRELERLAQEDEEDVELLLLH
jgi:hypothetical protein